MKDKTVEIIKLIAIIAGVCFGLIGASLGILNTYSIYLKKPFLEIYPKEPPSKCSCLVSNEPFDYSFFVYNKGERTAIITNIELEYAFSDNEKPLNEPRLINITLPVFLEPDSVLKIPIF